MGNHSTVIVAWCGADSEVQKQGPRTRLTRIVLDAPRMDLVREVTDVGLAVFSAKNFQPDDLLDCLRAMTWQYPEEVEIFRKDENMQHFDQWRLSALESKSSIAAQEEK